MLELNVNVGLLDKLLNAPSNASDIPYPAIVVGLPVNEANVPAVATPDKPKFVTALDFCVLLKF